MLIFSIGYSESTSRTYYFRYLNNKTFSPFFETTFFNELALYEENLNSNMRKQTLQNHPKNLRNNASYLRITLIKNILM